jgi:hypothetical protein
MNKPNLSQSLLKAYYQYINDKMCGLFLYNRYFLKKQTPKTPEQAEGIYFEYKATGYYHKEEGIPIAKKAYAGTARERLDVGYERAEQSAKLFKEIIKHYKIKILTAGERMEYNEASGLLDLRAVWNKKECIIDVKYTGLIDDKWSDYGWDTETLPLRKQTMLQPVMYKYLDRKINGSHNIPFYFFIFDSNNPKRAKIIETNVEDEAIDVFEVQFVDKMKKYVDFHHKNPDELQAKPTVDRCATCPFFTDCPKKVTIPGIETIDFGIADF